ncbi:GntR family transcriptional regulator [Amycolatopsis sp. RM579]|uniref:GntR family transcriptional regulator n=1 Tax=Amycolatopsis pithecellobii TaxID=664692 RepID=A0A6N7ZAT5_9PSEU|nr:GntR family transcriptional regulator [Amycolatopsis pithecellobii]
MYTFVAEHIAERIEAGDLPPNAVLPNEQRLAREYGVSLGPARHATRVLRERGLVVTIRSKGTYIAPPQTTKDSR